MANFLLSGTHCEDFFIDSGRVVWLILLIYNRNGYLSPTRLYTKFGVDTIKIQKVDVTLLFFCIMQISKTSIMVDLYGPWGLFVEHIEAWCEGHGPSKIVFLNGNYSTTLDSEKRD